MSTVIPSEHIEAIVGAKRHATRHLGRAVSAERQFYILHSADCFAASTDLRECPFSIALDRGINPDEWPLDQPVSLRVRNGYLTAPRQPKPEPTESESA